MAASLAALFLLVGACDFSVLESPAMPRWDVTLTLPLINVTYSLENIVDSSTIFEDTSNNEVQIEFSGMLDTTRIDPSYLQIILPASATPDPVSESVDAPDADSLFSPVTQTVSISILLNDLLQGIQQPGIDTLPSADTVRIPQDIWNNFMADTAIAQQLGPFEVIDTNTITQSGTFIKAFRYVQLSSIPDTSTFTTQVRNHQFPTTVDSIQIDIASGFMAVTHDTASIDSNSTGLGNVFAKTTDLASERLGSDLSMGFTMRLPTVSSDVIIPPKTNPRIDIDIVLTIGGVDSLAITTANVSLLPSAPAALPLPGDVQITRGVLTDTSAVPPINEISLLGLSNTLPFDINFALIFPNFDSPSAIQDSLIFGPHILVDGQAPINQVNSLGGYTFHNPAGNIPISSFEYQLVAEILEKDVVLPLDGLPMGTFQASFDIGDLYFESITGNFEIEFPTVPTTIEDIPTGFAGFQFDRLSLKLILHNQIDLPLTLNLDMIGITTRGDSAQVPIVAPLNYPAWPGGSASSGDTVNTIIILDQNTVSTFWLPGGVTDTSLADTVFSAPSGAATIVDVLNLAPDTLKVGGSAVIRGEGTVAANKAVWGEFELIAPFALVIENDMTFLPANPSELSPMDSSTRVQLKAALISASLTSRVITKFPIGGNFSMLISDTTLFSRYLDRLDGIIAGVPETVVVGQDTNVYTTLSQILLADSIENISHVVIYPEPEASAKPTASIDEAMRVDFYTSPTDTAPAFWIGRLFDMELPAPRSLNSFGHVVVPGDSTQLLALNAERVDWIASDKALYMKPLITLYGSGKTARTIQTTNEIFFSAFMSFNLVSDIFTPAEEADSILLTVTPPSASAYNIVIGDTIEIDLGTVFSHPDIDFWDLEYSWSVNQSGIVSDPTIRKSTVGNVGVVTFKTIGLRVGSAKMSIMADDDLDDDIPAQSTSILIIVSEAAAGSPPGGLGKMPPRKNGSRR